MRTSPFRVALLGLACLPLLATWCGSATGAAPSAADSRAAVQALKDYLALPPDQRPGQESQPWRATPLTREDASAAQRLLWQDHAARLRRQRAAEMQARELTLGKLKMPFSVRIFGTKPAAGRALVLSLHGGGGAPPAVNDSQWENQKRLYQLDEGVYVAPRAPTDTWNLWHEGHIDAFFDRLIENFVVFEEVDPNRVYLLGYSAGGDGVYQLAPRMADRWAAAAMMAGHPNETSPLGLRNLPFAIHVGALDAGYNRNKVAAEWGVKLADLRRQDPDGYVHQVELHAGKGHWMDRQDAKAIPWMMQHRRNPLPERIVWKQDDVVRSRFYWLAVDPSLAGDRAEIVAIRRGQSITIERANVPRLTVLLNDELLDLDQPVTIAFAGQSRYAGRAVRSIATLAKTLSERGDPHGIFSSEVRLELAPPTP